MKHLEFKVEPEISQFGIPFNSWRVIGNKMIWKGFATKEHAENFAKTCNDNWLKNQPT